MLLLHPSPRSINHYTVDVQSTAAIRDRNRLRIEQRRFLSTAVRRRFLLTEMLFTHDRFLSTVTVKRNR